ncbi:hypothetical protein UNDKW_3356 [Undibacterium sp. KW1]|uniref:hypothetical protein n=1 Tax=Undibacterium sp. KW1 TaxID=2058624 RepID=UPI001331E785|nr:hypothetical protein [Undibacterium sp. KW1]BBB61629.1 hypothetical protein UNDKW_3356 [Undibacterium sp. KW1]
MTQINDAFINAILANAAYDDDLNKAKTPGDLFGKLSERMTPDIAKYISENFVVLTQVSMPTSGFDVTVWQDKNNKVYVSMRGTAGGTDLLTDVNLAGSGNARAQITDMVNWWLRETTPEGQMAIQIRESFSELNTPPWGFETIPSVAGTGKIPASSLVGGIEVNGHSLGGYLASAFTRLFSAQAHVLHTTTFNSAGFAPGSEVVFQELDHLIGIGYGLGRFPNGAEQTNYFAKNGINVTTNSFWFNQVGQRQSVFNEGGTGLPNHYMYKLTDALRLGDALAKLDPSLDIVKLNAIYETASNQAESTLEFVLDGLRRVIFGDLGLNTAIGDVSNSAPTRLEYHKNISNLLNLDENGNPTGTFSSLQGKIQISAEEITDARKDIGQFLSLHYLTPFTVKVTDSQAEEKLISMQGKLGVLWQEDKNLSVTDRAAGKLNFSDEYLIDRTAMLGWLRLRNSKDNTDTTMEGPNLLFKDLALKTDIRLGSGMTGDAQRQHFVFGGELNDLLNGGDFSDDLYGGASNDTLNGGKGNDHLEGNEGNDQLTGGEDDDILLGGKGDDTYLFDGNYGKDTIFDSDEGGAVQIDGGVLTGGKKVTEGVWKGKDSNGVTYIYTVLDDGAGGKELVIKKEGSDNSKSITIKKWENKHLGIDLEGPPDKETEPGFDLVVRGDQGVVKHDGLSNNVDNVHMIGGEGNDSLSSSVGEMIDSVYGIGTNDWLEGNDGDDYLESGWGNDTLDGGAGNDVLIAGERYDGRQYDGVIPRSSGSDNDVVNGGSGNDLIGGDKGNDLLNGDDGDDIIIDGNGRDTINGGDGDDWIFAVGAL